MLDSVLTVLAGREVAISSTENRIRFGLFELDLSTRQLTKNGARVRLPQQPIKILSILLERPGEIVTREELRRRLWPSDVFVDFDHGLNKAIQKLRDALGDSAGSPRYVETIPRVGYRFIAPVDGAGTILGAQPETNGRGPEKVLASSPDGKMAATAGRRPWRWLLPAAWIVGLGACVAIVIAIARSPHQPPEVLYTQLTDFTDSAVAPALSPDGHMVAFIRGNGGFLTSDEIYVKLLPNGEARRVTDDARAKYALAFSPDGSEITYTVLQGSVFSTYAVSALGGEPHLLLENAAGLVWLDRQQVLFSEVRPGEGIHLGVVAATVTRSGLREIYFPAHQRGMAHASYPSPDRRWALVVEMNGNGEWAPCRLVALEGGSPARSVGPAGACTSAGWSPDGRWMYFTATVEGHSHIWRQRFADGKAEQITFGPTEEDGIAVEPTGHALITSVGVEESAIWVHDRSGERPLSSEGEVEGHRSPPVFSPDAGILYYLLRTDEAPGTELWRTAIDSGKSEAVFPGISMVAFDVSQDGKEVVYTTAAPGGTTQLWLAPADRSVPARKLGISGVRAPHFGPGRRVFFQQPEGRMNYLEQIDTDGSHRRRVFSYPVIEVQGVSPGGRWIMAAVPRAPESNSPAVVAIPVEGGAPRQICASYCFPRWSPDGKFLFVTVEEPSRSSTGRSLAIPVGPGESLPDLPAGGIEPRADAGVVRGAESVARGELVPGTEPGRYAWVNTTVHRNLYRISLP
jgi:DNA-binding winged helix-turn-helix (wHTH) protein/Tol biopolymer transport system component